MAIAAAERLPTEFVDRLRLILGERFFDQALDSFSRERQTSFRVNSLKVETEALTRELVDAGFSLVPIPWNPDAFSVPPDQRRALTDTAACREGRLYIQNPSSMLVPMVLDPRPQDQILDLCAAPGSKTLQLAAMMSNGGRIAAVDSVRARFFKLRANLEIAGVENADTYLKDGSGVWRQCRERFDRVLVDAPCSSEGRFSAGDPASFANWRPRKIREMQRKQRRLLFSAVQSLRPGGTLVYSTCTFAPEENEVVVDGLVRRFSSALRVEAIEPPCSNVQNGLTRWSDKPLNPELAKAVRLLPDNLMEGFFICKIAKVGSTLA